MNPSLASAARACAPALSERETPASLDANPHDHDRDLRALEAGYRDCLADVPRRACVGLSGLAAQIAGYGVEGLRGWGKPPGKVMVSGTRLLVPGLRFGKITTSALIDFNGYTKMIFMGFLNCGFYKWKAMPCRCFHIFTQSDIPDLYKICFMRNLILYSFAAALLRINENKRAIICQVFKWFRNISG